MRLPLPLPAAIGLGGALSLSGFGLVLLLAAALGIWLAGRRVRLEAPQLAGAIQEALVATAMLGLVCARLASQWAAPDIVWTQPLTWLRLTGTDVSWAGGLAEGVIGFSWLMRRRGIDWRWAGDRVVPAACAGIALAWLGLPLVGRPTQVPWGLILAPGVAVHPVQLYGALGFAGLGWFLAWQLPRAAYPGQNLVSFVALASAFRLLLGFFLPGTGLLGPWTQAQVADGAILAASLLWARGLSASRAPEGSAP